MTHSCSITLHTLILLYFVLPQEGAYDHGFIARALDTASTMRLPILSLHVVAHGFRMALIALVGLDFAHSPMLLSGEGLSARY